MRYRDLLRTAEQLGAESGNQSASWYWDRTDPKKEDFQRVLKGINDGDPEILDTFVSGSLSGEWADGMTPDRLYKDLGANDRQIGDYGDELCTAFEQAHDKAYVDSIVDQCRTYLETEITITINATITEVTSETLNEWASQVEEAAARHPEVSIDDVTTADEDGQILR